MAGKRNEQLKDIVEYCANLGLEVNTSTKARGHQGVFLHNNKDLRRIDISKNLPDERILPVIAHEFAHFFHHTLDDSFESLQEIFGIKQEVLIPELEAVTSFLTGEELQNKLENEVEKIKLQIADLEKTIKLKYPQFKRSQKFKEFERYIKNSPAKFLLKYDRVRVLECFKTVEYSIDNIEAQFPNMPEEFVAYINIRSLMRRFKRYSSKKRKLKNYYSRSSELFARFIECYTTDKEALERLAPYAFEAFKERVNFRSFKVLKEFLDLIEKSV